MLLLVLLCCQYDQPSVSSSIPSWRRFSQLILISLCTYSVLLLVWFAYFWHFLQYLILIKTVITRNTHITLKTCQNRHYGEHLIHISIENLHFKLSSYHPYFGAFELGAGHKQLPRTQSTRSVYFNRIDRINFHSSSLEYKILC